MNNTLIQTENWAEIGVFVSVCGSVVVSLCFAIQKSRCDKIKCCCMDIHRIPKDETQTEPEVVNP